MSSPDHNPYVPWALGLTEAAAAVANYCDHAEHNEALKRAWVTDAAETLRTLSAEIAAHEHENLYSLYAARLRQIEQRNPLWGPCELDGGALVEQASTWRALQLAQAEHDRRYHADVFGLSKMDQLRHYAFHLAKLAGAIAEVAGGHGDHDDFCKRRLPDLLLFGLKLSTVMGEQLHADALTATGQLAVLSG